MRGHLLSSPIGVFLLAEWTVTHLDSSLNVKAWDFSGGQHVGSMPVASRGHASLWSGTGGKLV